MTSAIATAPAPGSPAPGSPAPGSPAPGSRAPGSPARGSHARGQPGYLDLKVEPNDVLAGVAAVTGVPAEHIIQCAARDDAALEARRIYCYLCREMACASLPMIAATLIGSSGSSSHSAVYERVRRIEIEVLQHPRMSLLLAACRREIYAAARQRAGHTPGPASDAAPVRASAPVTAARQPANMSQAPVAACTPCRRRGGRKHPSPWMRLSLQARTLWAALERARTPAADVSEGGSGDDSALASESDLGRAMAILAVSPRMSDAEIDDALHELIGVGAVRLRLRPVVCEDDRHARRVAIVVAKKSGSLHA